MNQSTRTQFCRVIIFCLLHQLSASFTLNNVVTRSAIVKQACHQNYLTHHADDTCDILTRDIQRGTRAATKDGDDDVISKKHTNSSKARNRREFFASALAATLLLSNASAGNAAIKETYPEELQYSKGDKDIEAVRRDYITSKRLEQSQRKNILQMPDPKNKSDFKMNTLTSTVWAVALWLLGGSRQNALVNPTANLLFDPKQEQWLKDRNEGLFSPLPADFQIILGALFLTLGFAMNRFVLFGLTEGDANLSLQLASVSVITGGFYELGRVAIGEKDVSREEANREDLLEQEFNEFARQRLIVGGIGSNRSSCHRNEVVASFRRFYAKYRTADANVDFTLGDLEIEQLLRSWYRREMGSSGNISSAGFLQGVRINVEADIALR